MFVDVCVKNSSFNGKDYYTYKVPSSFASPLLPGSLVKVPFGKEILSGIVIKTKDHVEFNTKEIIQVLKPFPVLTQKQLILLSLISQYFYCPMSLALSYFLQVSFPKLLPDHSQPLSQTLILIPTPNYPLRTKVDTIYHHQLSTAERQRVWSETYSGSRSLIVGTRSSLYLPFNNLKEIVIHEADNLYHTDKRMPYQHSAQIANFLSQIFQARLNILYSPNFKQELQQRELLGYPPYSNLALLTPKVITKKSLQQALTTVIELKEKANTTGFNIEIIKNFNSESPEIYLKGRDIHKFLENPPKGWRVKIYYLNIN